MDLMVYDWDSEPETHQQLLRELQGTFYKHKSCFQGTGERKQIENWKLRSKMGSEAEMGGDRWTMMRGRQTTFC